VLLPPRVARWFVFKPKIPLWVNFGGPCNGKSCFILRPFGLFYGNLKHFMAIGYILWSFGIFFPVLVFCTKKNLATLLPPPWLVALLISPGLKAAAECFVTAKQANHPERPDLFAKKIAAEPRSQSYDFAAL
jgi:hypothetical protein